MYRIGDLSLELDLELLLKLLEFIKAIPLLNSDISESVNNDVCKPGIVDKSFSFAPQNSEYLRDIGDHQFPKRLYTLSEYHTSTTSLPEVVPIGAPWQNIYLLAKRQDKIYVEAFSLAPVKMSLRYVQSSVSLSVFIFIFVMTFTCICLLILHYPAAFQAIHGCSKQQVCHLVNLSSM